MANLFLLSAYIAMPPTATGENTPTLRASAQNAERQIATRASTPLRKENATGVENHAVGLIATNMTTTTCVSGAKKQNAK